MRQYGHAANRSADNDRPKFRAVDALCLGRYHHGAYFRRSLVGAAQPRHPGAVLHGAQGASDRRNGDLRYPLRPDSANGRVLN